jgi:O-antigen/teichoic acid export membrane protein
MSVQQRVTRALAANAFGQVVTIATQLLLTPLFFRTWGAGLYGEWLILSSVPAYLTMADLGIGSAAGNEMAMRAGAGDHAGAQQTYRGATWVGLMAGAGVMLVGALLALAAAHLHWPRTELIPAADAGWLITLLTLNVALGFQGGVISAGFRAAGCNALAISLSNTSRLLEGLGMGVALLMGQGPLVLCAAALVIKAVMLLVQHLWLKAQCGWLFTPRVAADRQLVRRLIAPSLGFMAFPLGNALALQAPILIIGHALGGPAVAVFSAMRTLARLPMQIANAFNASVWPEMSRAHGAGDTALLRKLHRSSWAVALPLAAGAGLGLVLLGEWIGRLWLGPKVQVDPTVLLALVVVTVLSVVWNASSVVMAAINAHARLGALYVLANGVCMGVAWWLTPTLQWWGLLPMLVLAELVLLLWVFPRVLRLTGDTVGQFFGGAWTRVNLGASSAAGGSSP